MRLPAENGSITVRQELTLRPDGIAWRSAVGDGRVAWTAVRDIVDDGQHAFIFVDDVAGMVVPMRAFPSAEEYRRFVDTAHVHWRRATAAPAA
jgi:hypothetical protein